MGLVCGAPTRFMPAAAARTAQATTITPALGAGVKNENRILSTSYINHLGQSDIQILKK